jgi:hypothetical protein
MSARRWFNGKRSYDCLVIPRSQFLKSQPLAQGPKKPMTPIVRALTQRDLEVLLALLHKVRIFSIRQLAEHWWSSELTNARKRLRLLADSNLLVGVKVSARTLPPLCAPVACWQPGQRVPDFGAISYQLKSRWKQRPTRSVAAYVASERAARLLGGAKRVGLKAGT